MDRYIIQIGQKDFIDQILPVEVIFKLLTYWELRTLICYLLKIEVNGVLLFDDFC